MALSIKINGLQLTTFTEASVIADIGAVTRGFSFTNTANAENFLPVRVKNEVEILADNISILKGFVETLEGEYEAKPPRHKLKITGRSILADLVDSSVPTQTEFTKLNLIDICKEVMIGIGLKPTVINNAGTIKPFDDVSSAEVGQQAFKFLESYSRKRQVLLTTDGLDGLVLARAGTTRAPTNLKMVIQSNQNNIKRVTFDFNDRERYNKYSVKSQLNPMFAGAAVSPEEISDQSGIIFDPEIRSTRQLEFEAEESMEDFSATNRAKWEANIRKAKSFSYTATVVGHSVNGQLWLPNTLINVVDNFADIAADLLIKGVTYNYSLEAGSTTTLRMTYRNAYTLDLEQTERQALVEKTGGEFSL